MGGVVLELQTDALNADIDILTLLRKAFLVAKKLKLSDFEEWINHESNGYQDIEPPNYRKVFGEVKFWNPFHGWMPLLIGDKDMYEALSNRLLSNSVSSLVPLINSETTPAIPFPGDICSKISESIGFETKFALFISKNAIETIIETVRTKILEWAIVLEEIGITGDGLTFSAEEKEIANSNPQIIHYTNNFYKNAENIQIQQGTEYSNQRQ